MAEAIFIERQPRTDRVQIAALVGLMVVGAVFVYSATMASEAAAAAAWYKQSWLRQIVWYVLGAGAGATVCLLDYRTLARWSFVGCWIMILLLVAY
jgi:cell division protein FtsW (lipid II flippase)